MASAWHVQLNRCWLLRKYFFCNTYYKSISDINTVAYTSNRDFKNSHNVKILTFIPHGCALDHVA